MYTSHSQQDLNYEASAPLSHENLRLEHSSNYYIPRALEHDFVIYEHETDYSFLYFKSHVGRYLRELHDVIWWNSIICLSVLAAVVTVMVEDYDHPQSGIQLIYATYNILYALHVAGIAYVFYTGEKNMTVSGLISFCVDIISFSHYLVGSQRTVTLILYSSRLHRAFMYILYVNDYNVGSSILGTGFKISYTSAVIRVAWTIIWMYSHEFFGKKTVLKDEDTKPIDVYDSRSSTSDHGDVFLQMLRNMMISEFFKYFYAINKMFIPVGTSADLSSDFERILCVLVMVSGCLMLAGAAIAAMSLVFSIHMTPEEAFRRRYRLIMKELKNSDVSPVLQQKVETFYMMYWQKQRAVSTAELLATLPPSLLAAIDYDIYFKAMQKSKILRELPNHLLTEVAKVMTTIHYVPGDTIIARESKKSSMYYITYGDIEMLTAEDDSTAILRMARGTILTSCSGCTLVGCGRAHVAIRAATYCTAQVLSTVDLWKLTLRQGKYKDKAAYIVWPFYEHLEKVKMHYARRTHPKVPYLSSILHFKHGLISLKEAKDEDGKPLLSRPDIFLEIAGCYLTRSQIENDHVDESDAICLRQRFPCILQPSSSLLIVWNTFFACLTLTVCITHPYFLTFKETVPVDFIFFNHVVTLLYIVDLIVFLSTGEDIEEGVAITFTQTASQQMQRGRFVIDVLATVPCFEFIGDGHFAGINKLLKLPQLFRYLKWVEDNCVYHGNIVRFCIYTLLVCILCYLLAAFKQGFTCFQFHHCEIKNFTHPPHWQKGPLNDTTIREKITFGLYWAISLLSLTSHMDKYIFSRVMYSIFTLELVLVLHIIIEAVYSATIMVTSAMRQNFDMYIHIVQEFLIRNSVHPLLRQRFITYLELCWYTDQAYSITHQKSSIFYDLPPHVSQDIIAKQCSSFILSLPFMKFLRKKDLNFISYRSNLFHTSPAEILLNTGNYSDDLYVIKKGICEVLCPVTKKRVRILSANSHYGILECLLRFPTYYTIRAVTHVEIIKVKRKFLMEVDALEIPQIKYALDAVKNQPEFDKLRQHRLGMFAMYEPPPGPPNRQIFKQRRKYESDAEFLEPFTRIGFLSLLRYVFPRFTLRPDGAYLERYEWFRAGAALAAAILYPSHTYLRLQFPALKVLASLLDFSAYFDILQRMIVGYYNDKGILVYHPASTSAHYLRGAFIVDLMGCLPLEDMQPRVKHGEVFSLTPLRQFLMLNRLLQLYRFFHTIDALNVYLRKDIMLVLKALPLLTTICNVLTLCIVMSSVEIFYTINIDSKNYTISTNNDTGGNWIHIFKDAYRFKITENLWNLHLATYFWVIYETTTTGYKTINPTNYQIMEILFVGMITSSMITTYFSVRVISERANVNKALCTFQEHKRDIHKFMEREMLDETLKKRVYDYYDYNWDNMGGVETRSLLKLCDQVSLRTDIILDIYGDTFVDCPFLPEHDVTLLRVLSRGVRDAHFVRGTLVIARDDVIDHVYIVNKGVVTMRVDAEDRCNIFNLGRGSVFGDLERHPIRSPQMAMARTDVHLLQINSQVFHGILDNFPAVVDLLAQYRPNGEMYVISKTKNVHHNYSKKIKKTLSAFEITDIIKRKYSKKIPNTNLILASVCYFSLVGELFNIGFQNNHTMTLTLLYIMDVLFLLKIIALVHIPKGNKKQKKQFIQLRHSYITKKFFKMDVASCIPMEAFSLLVAADQGFAYSWLRINRFFRIVTLYKCMVRRHKRLSMNLALSTMFSVFVWFTLFVHAVSCLFYYIGTLEDNKKPGSSWKYKADGTMNCNNHYVCSMYFILSSFTHNGVGDIMPRTHAERMIVGYYNDKGILVYHPASTSAHYLRGAFIVDLMGCLPLEDMQPRVKHGEVFSLTPLRQFLMLNRLLQLYRFFHTIDALNVYLRKDIMLVLKALPLLTTICNVLTLCIVMSSVEIFYTINIDSKNYTISTNNDTGGNWIHIFKDAYRFKITENLWNLHLATYFWVIYETTTTGYKTINPTNYQIMEILFVGMITSSMITTYFSVRVISERANVNKALCTFQEHKRDIHKFMEREMLDETLKKRVYDYYDYNWDNMGGVETRSLLKLCDQVSLRTDIILDIYGDTFVDCPFLPEHDVTLLRVLSRGVRDAHFVRGTLVIARDDVIDHVYIVNKGVVTMRVDAEDRCNIFNLGRGSVFGDLERHPIRSPQMAMARTDVHLLQINSQVFHGILDNFPAVVDLLAQYRPNGEMYVISKTKNVHHNYSKKIKKTLSAFEITDIIKRKYSKKIPNTNLILASVCYFSLVGELFNIGFQNNHTMTLTLLYIMDVLFLLKIIALVHIPKGNKKQKKQFIQLRHSYITKKFFKMDVASCIPMEAFSLLVAADQGFAYSWLRINRFFRIVTLYKCMVRRHKRLSMNLALSTMFSVFVWFTLFVHAVSCLFYYIGTLEDNKKPGSSWKYKADGTMNCNNHYVCSMYFILSSFTHNGVGDIMPRTHAEVILVALLAIMSTMVLMIYVGEFSNIVQYHSFRSFNFYSSYLQLKTYLNNNRVSEALLGVIEKYCLHLWRESRGYQLPHFLTTAPLPLKLQVMTAAYLHHLDRHPVFQKCEPAFIRQLTGCFKLYTYNDELPIVLENEITDSMYFIHKGSVLEYTERNKSIRIYKESGHFGEGLHRDKPFEHSYRSIHKSQILMLYLNDWEYLLEHFPQSKAAIYGNQDHDDADNGQDAKRETKLDSQKVPEENFIKKSILTIDTMKETKTKSPTNSSYMKDGLNTSALQGADELVSVFPATSVSTSLEGLNSAVESTATVDVQKTNSTKLLSSAFTHLQNTNSTLPSSLTSIEDLMMPGFSTHVASSIRKDSVLESQPPESFKLNDELETRDEKTFNSEGDKKTNTNEDNISNVSNTLTRYDSEKEIKTVSAISVIKSDKDVRPKSVMFKSKDDTTISSSESVKVKQDQNTSDTGELSSHKQQVSDTEATTESHPSTLQEETFGLSVKEETPKNAEYKENEKE